MKQLWKTISRIGINEDLAALESRSIILVNRTCSVIWVICFLSLVINVLLGISVFIPAFLLTLLLLLFTYYFNHKKFYLLAKSNLIVVAMALLMYMSFKGAYGSGLEYYFLSLLTLPVVVFREKKYTYLFFVLILCSLIGLKFYAHIPEAMTFSLPHKVFYVFNSICSGLLIILAVHFYKDITQEGEEALLSKNAIIEDKNQQLNAFTYSVSHDLKAPLRAINGFSGMLKEDYASGLPEKGQELLEKVQRNALHMQEMIDNLLLFSKTARQEMHPVQFSMNELVKEVIEELKPEIGHRSIDIKIDKLGDLRADRKLISHVMWNLLSNAIKYTRNKEQAVIEVGFYTDKGNKVYFVKDNGAGFDMNYASRLFTPFQRLHNQKDYEGSGVGLSIVKNIVQRHGGTVWAEGEKDKGAAFYFSIP